MVRLTAIARKLRKDQTPAEGVLWQQLRANRLGYKFYRQHPIGGYVADFCCPAVKLVIEVDGGHHDEPEQRAQDRERDSILDSQGFTVLRVWNNEVQKNTDGVVQKILDTLKQFSRLSP
jgi:very-short-patch-repair endonuclease